MWGFVCFLQGLYLIYIAPTHEAPSERNTNGKTNMGQKNYESLYKSLYGSTTILAGVRGDTLAVILVLFSYSAGRSLSYLGIIISSADDF